MIAFIKANHVSCVFTLCGRSNMFLQASNINLAMLIVFHVGYTQGLPITFLF
jgi:hypothetical protein